jgi:hypothetical protein
MLWLRVRGEKNANVDAGVAISHVERRAMNVTPTCSSKNCSKPRFLGYYVCAEHFVYYVAPQYTESMVIKVEPGAQAGLRGVTKRAKRK